MARERKSAGGRPTSDNAGVAARRARVAELHGQGMVLQEIQAQMKEEANPDWGVGELSRDVIRRDIQAIRDNFRENHSEVVFDTRMRQNARCEVLWKMAYEERDVRGCIAVMERQAKLLGLDAAEKQQVQVQVGAGESVLRAFLEKVNGEEPRELGDGATEADARIVDFETEEVMLEAEAEVAAEGRQRGMAF